MENGILVLNRAKSSGRRIGAQCLDGQPCGAWGPPLPSRGGGLGVRRTWD